jgi:sugar phosphate isomerase/epimerase
MRCSLSAYSMSRPLRAGDIDVLGIADLAAELGYEGLEMLDMCWEQNGSTIEEQADRLRQRCEALGLAIASYTVHNNFAQMDADRQTAEVERIKASIDLGKRLGVKRMRIESTNGAPKEYEGRAEWEDMVPWLVDGIRRVADHAGSLGIVLGLENHGRVVGRSAQVEELIRKVDSPYFGATPDIGNFYVVDEEPVDALTRLAKYTVFAHVKDFHREPPGTEVGDGWFESNGGYKLCGAIVGEGVVDVAGCLRLLKQAGYEGFVSLEFEGREDSKVGCSKGLANLRSTLATL